MEKMVWLFIVNYKWQILEWVETTELLYGKESQTYN